MKMAANYNENLIVKITLYVSFAIALFAVGCFHGEKITRVQPGMSVEDLKSTMGPQEGYRKIGDYEIYSYYNKLISGWAWDRADYHYVFKRMFLGRKRTTN